MLLSKSLFALLQIAQFCISAPNQEQKEEEIPFTISAPRMRVPKWSHGSLIAVLNHESLDPQIWLIEPLRRRTVPFKIPGAQTMIISDWDRGGPGGSMIGLGGAVTYADGSASGFIAWIFADDPLAVPQIVTTGRHSPSKIAVAPDGSIWTSAIKATPAPEDRIIRRFDRSGKLLGSFLQQPAIPDHFPQSQVRTALRASGDRVAWCCPTATK